MERGLLVKAPLSAGFDTGRPSAQNHQRLCRDIIPLGRLFAQEGDGAPVEKWLPARDCLGFGRESWVGPVAVSDTHEAE